MSDRAPTTVQAARAHEEALGAARLEAKEAREVHGVLEKECAAKDEIERVISTAGPREHEPATAAELQLLRESVEEAARCNAVTEADAAAGAAGAGVLGTTAESGRRRRRRRRSRRRWRPRRDGTVTPGHGVSRGAGQTFASSG